MNIRCGFRVLAIVVAVLAGTVSISNAQQCLGTSCFNVGCGQSQYEFGGTSPNPPIPADFFDPGSDPFIGVIGLGGTGTGTDTKIDRLDELRFCLLPPSQSTISIEIVELSLVSCQPITVSFNGGSSTEDWVVDVTLSDPNLTPSLGTMTVTKTHENGGTYSSSLNVQPKFIFRSVLNPLDVRVLDTGLDGRPASNIVTGPSPWLNVALKTNSPCDGGGFYPASAVVMQGPGMILDLQPPEDVRVHFLLGSEQDWIEALADGRIHPLPQAEGDNYINQINANLQEGAPYPPATFIEAQLSVLPAGMRTERAGLLMVWDNNNLVEGQDYASAWRYKYPDDPDLTATTIDVTVDPPCGMSVVSLGMVDINGNIRVWYWLVAPAGALPPYPVGTIPCSPFPPTTTTVSINTSLTGVAAATPVAASYSSGPGAFDITMVTDFTFDEDNVFVGTAGAPVPGSGAMANWNYWHDLLVTPNTSSGGGGAVNSKWFTKWSQPPVELEPGLIDGWDELSNYLDKPIMADDWLCKDARPITDIHWWGSFIGWTHPTPPPVVPIGFHIGIWTDVPAFVDKPYSHPGTLVWENFCHTSTWNFAGYDVDPRVGDPNWQEDEACFQFAQFLSQDEWFYQDPNSGPAGTVYWLSISAIYPAGEVVTYPWGWKTRPHHFNDDAVHITGLASGIWPPVIGSIWDAGLPVVNPIDLVSWDLAFELTTNDGLAADFDLSGKVDFADLAFFAISFLDIFP